MGSDDEKRILDLWPKYEDGGYVMPGDVAVANNGAKKGRAFTVVSVRVNTVGVCLTDCDGSYWNYKAGDRRVKRPEPEDSWERLDRDAGKGVCGYFGHSWMDCDGCPLDGRFGCDEYVRHDLVRRAKALSEGGGRR